MKKILVATDGSQESGRALDRAIEAAKAGPAEIIVVNVAEEWCPIGLVEVDCDTISRLVMKEAEGVMEAALAKTAAAGLTARGIIEKGSPAEAIIEVAKRENADEIIAASHGKHGAKKLAMGSVSARLVEWAPCPVTVVK
ncbi:MAG TPA: universal stress protein [Dissulfurispiraceae bacterium]|nr:universal stress protein [Dissulfurispiraceae bacterium]